MRHEIGQFQARPNVLRLDPDQCLKRVLRGLCAVRADVLDGLLAQALRLLGDRW